MTGTHPVGVIVGLGFIIATLLVLLAAFAVLAERIERGYRAYSAQQRQQLPALPRQRTATSPTQDPVAAAAEADRPARSGDLASV